MKTINKSEIFKNAWNLVKKMSLNFADALRQAWQQAKKQALVSLATTTQFFEITFTKNPLANLPPAKLPMPK